VTFWCFPRVCFRLKVFFAAFGVGRKGLRHPLILAAAVVFLVEVLRIVRYCSRALANVAKGIGFPTV